MIEEGTQSSGLVEDASYVLGELARGEISCAADPRVAAAADELSKAVSAAKSASSPDDGAKVEKALTTLMALLSPITIQTLRDTDGAMASPFSIVSQGRISPMARISNMLFGSRPAAFRFSTAFSVATVLIVAAALLTGYWSQQPDTYKFQAFGKAVAPFTYGAMGACVFLLRSLHRHIYGRTFDRRRKPEYYNRILLGAISGGAVVLLLQSGYKEGGEATKLSFNALGFLAGYNTDLLFTTIERVMNAILPKTAPAPAPPPAAASPPAPPAANANPPSPDANPADAQPAPAVTAR